MKKVLTRNEEKGVFRKFQLRIPQTIKSRLGPLWFSGPRIKNFQESITRKLTSETLILCSSAG